MTPKANRTTGGRLVYVEGRARPIGRLRDGVLHTVVFSARGHMLRQPPGWAIEESTLDGVTEGIRLTDGSTDTVYWVSRADFDRYSFAIERRFGKQRALPLRYWSIDGEPPTTGELPPAAPDPEPPPAPPVQLTLAL